MSKPVPHYDKWRIRWTDEKGTRRSKTFTEFKTADLALRKAELEAEERRRGLRAPEMEPCPFSKAANYWRTYRSPKKRSFKDDIAILKQLEEHFGRILLNDIAAWVPAVDRYLAKKSRLSEKTLHNHLTLLISVLRMARSMRWVEQLPEIKKPKAVVDDDYSYLKNREEMTRFLEAAKEEGEMVFMLYLTAVCTGARAGELGGMEWADVDFTNRLITIRHSFAGPTKSNRKREVPILDALLPHLREWKLKHPGRLVFSNRDGGMLQPSGRIYQEALHRVLKRAGFPKVMRNGKLRHYIHFHDLRHSFASHWMLGSGDIFKLQKILGHRSQVMTQRYAHLDPNAYGGDYGRLGQVPTFAANEATDDDVQVQDASVAAS